MDPLQALQAAYSVPADSAEQADLLSKLRENLEAYPSYIPVLCSSLIRGVSGAQDSLLKHWTLDLLHYGISRANLPVEKRTERAYLASLLVGAVRPHKLPTSQLQASPWTFWPAFSMIPTQQ